MAERKELMRDIGDIKSKMAEIDKAILAADLAGEDTEALDKEFADQDKKKKSLMRALARKESLDDQIEDDTEDKDVDDDDGVDEDEEEESAKSRKAKKGKKALYMPAVHGLSGVLRRTKLSPIQRAGAYFWGKAAMKMHGPRHAHDTIMRVWGDEGVAKAAVGAMTTAIPTIVQDASQVVIDILSAKSIVRASGARIEDMSRGNKTIFRQNAGAQAFFFGEGQTSTVSQVGFDHLDLSWHKMGALVYLTKEELLFPSINTGEYVVNEITRRIALKEDAVFLLNSSVVQYQPTGIPYWTNASNLVDSTTISGSVTWQSIANDLANAESQLSGKMNPPPYAWYMHNNVGTFLKAVTNGFTFPFREELSKEQPTLNGHPVYYSQQIPTNSGESSNETAVYLVKPENLIVADAYQYDVQMSSEGSFNDGGTQVNLWGEQKVAFLATSAIDFATEHDVSAAILTATGWTTSGGIVAGADRYTQASATTTSSASSVVSG